MELCGQAFGVGVGDPPPGAVRVEALLAGGLVGLAARSFAPFGLNHVEGVDGGAGDRGGVIVVHAVGLVDFERTSAARAQAVVESQPGGDDRLVCPIPAGVGWRLACPFPRRDAQFQAGGQLVAGSPEFAWLKGTTAGVRFHKIRPVPMLSKSPELRKPVLASSHEMPRSLPSLSSAVA